MARPEKIFATRNSAITSPFLPKLPPTLSLLKKQSFKILKYESTIYCSFPSKHLKSIFFPKEKLKGHDVPGLQSVGTFSPEKLEMHISHLSRPLSAIPDNCHFWYATIFFRPVKGTPKNCVTRKQRKSICGIQLHILQIISIFCILGVLFGVLGFLFGVLGVLVGVLGVFFAVLGVFIH